MLSRMPPCRACTSLGLASSSAALVRGEYAFVVMPYAEAASTPPVCRCLAQEMSRKW